MAIEYQKGDSGLHRLDARTKLLLFVGLTVLAVLILDPLIIAAMFLLLYEVGARAIDRRMLNRNLRVLVVIFLTFSAFQIFFFTPEDAHFLFYLVPGTQWIPVTVQGIVRGAAVFFRFFIVVLSVHLMLYTTPPVEMVLALTRRARGRRGGTTLAASLALGVIFFAIAVLGLPETVSRIPLEGTARVAALAAASAGLGYVTYRVASHGLPPEMGMALSLGFATVGVLSQQAKKISDAQKARGYDVRPRNLIRRVQVLTALLLPIFLATLERSQDIAVAILARAFDYNIAGRTYRRELHFRTRDYLVIGLIMVLIVGGLGLGYYGIESPTESWILQWIQSRTA
jgi:energy-coupling factor transporter transmembrane protein EcfT